jgi:hypothetical protein
VESAVGESVVVSVRKETDHRVAENGSFVVETEARAPRENVVSVRKETDHRVAENGSFVVETEARAPRENVVSVRKETDHRVAENGVHVPHAVRGESAQHAPRGVIVNRKPHRLPRLHQGRHHHRQRILVRLRASRGDSKPCYWHRHVQSTADSIAVV